MTLWSSHGIGRIAPGEADVVLLPSAYPQDGSAVGIVYCHASGGSALSASNPVSHPGEWTLVRSLAERYPVVVADLGGPQTFGNDLALARIGAAGGYLRTAWGARQAPMVLVGTSMGALAALSYAAAHRDDVATVVGVLPLVDLDAAYSANIAGLALAIAKAWGVPLGAPLPERASPTHRIDALAGLPFQGWCASDDPAAPVGSVLDLVAAIGLPAEVHDLGRLGHTNAAIAAVRVEDIIAFVESTSAAVPA